MSGKMIEIPFVTIGDRRGLTGLQMLQHRGLSDFVRRFHDYFERSTNQDLALFIEPNRLTGKSSDLYQVFIDIVRATAEARSKKLGIEILVFDVTRPVQQIVINVGLVADVIISPLEVQKNPGQEGIVDLIMDKFQDLEEKIERRMREG